MIFTNNLLLGSMSYFVRKVFLKQSPGELSFKLCGHNPCMVCAVPLSDALDNVQLRCGDEILEVNFINVGNMNFKEVQDLILQKMSAGKVLLNVRTLYFQNLVHRNYADQTKSRSNSLTRPFPKPFFEKEKAKAVNNDHHNTIVKDLTYLPKLFGLNSSAESKRLPQFINNHENAVFMFYLCSEKIPLNNNDDLLVASSDCLKTCVSQLQSKGYSHSSLVLFTMNYEGVSLYNLIGKKIITYSTSSIVYCDVYTEDRNYLCIVCRVIKTNGAKKLLQYECNVFKIDRALSRHENHRKLAVLFHLPCSRADNCQHFPSATHILNDLNDVLKNRYIYIQCN